MSLKAGAWAFLVSSCAMHPDDANKLVHEHSQADLSSLDGGGDVLAKIFQYGLDLEETVAHK